MGFNNKAGRAKGSQGNNRFVSMVATVQGKAAK
jgi:hypothetical protein